MTKEQEKAIEILNKFKNNEMQRDKLEISRDGGWKIGDIYKLLELNQAIETVLNMIKERDEEIENHKKKNKELSNQILKLYKEQDNYNARIEKKNKEIKEKDKQIDLIAEFLGERDLGYYKNETDGEILGIMRKYNKEDWKQYFKRKATNNG